MIRRNSEQGREEIRGARNCRNGGAENERAKGKGNTTIIDRTCVCFLSERSGGASEKEAPTAAAKSKEKERRSPQKKGVSNHPHTNPFFQYYAKPSIHFPSLKAAMIEVPPPPGIIFKQ